MMSSRDLGFLCGNFLVRVGSAGVGAHMTTVLLSAAVRLESRVWRPLCPLTRLCCEEPPPRYTCRSQQWGARGPGEGRCTPSIRLSCRVLCLGLRKAFLHVQGFRFFPSVLRGLRLRERQKQHQQFCWGCVVLFCLLSVRAGPSPLTLVGPARPPKAKRGMQALGLLPSPAHGRAG